MSESSRVSRVDPVRTPTSYQARPPRHTMLNAALILPALWHGMAAGGIWRELTYSFAALHACT